MFKGHPKGLYVAFFSNMGERFGFYTMMAILVLFLQAKFNLHEDSAGSIYSYFYFAIYALALLGGFLADLTKNYKGIILLGIVIMFAGYVLLAVPGMGFTLAIIGLFTIALGNGLFKGNLQALVGQMYDNPTYSHLRDGAYSIFYMGINIGAFFAPSAASGILNWYLGRSGFTYDQELPKLCNQFISNTMPAESLGKLQSLADGMKHTQVADLMGFAKEYITVFSTGYNYAFGIAAIAMLISLAVYLIFKHHLPDRKAQSEKGAGSVPQMTKTEESQRIFALILVFLVVIFFWMSFHQNGLTLTFFARDYTAKVVDKITYLFFNLWSFIGVLAAMYGIVFMVRKKSTNSQRLIGAAVAVVGAALAIYKYSGFSLENSITAEIFQQFNPVFIVVLTPVVITFFKWLNDRGKEPSTPKKIGFGMILAAVGFALILLGSLGLPSPVSLHNTPSPVRVSPNWLIGNYFILTVAELFLSPMGLSFVSKVAPPRWQGLMQGGWLGATAIGNKLLFVGSTMWVSFELWQVWGVFTICCLVSAAFIFSIMKRLERATTVQS